MEKEIRKEVDDAIAKAKVLAAFCFFFFLFTCFALN
jgi:hypothetical protein